ncbi:MAG: endo-1,4-beta-xylanase [Porcipelethomonas sp.]
MNKIKCILSCITAAVMVICMASALPFSATAETVEIFKDTFEDGFGGWAGRGDASIQIVDTAANSGKKSLYVTGRQKAWNGAACAKIKELRNEKTYYISGYVMQDEGNDTEDINLQVLYKDANGDEQYKNIARAQAKKGVWTNVGANYTIPADATGITVYFETPSNLINFYIDDVYAEGEPNDDSDTTEGFADDFENGVNGWSGRGNAVCEISEGNGNNGSACLYTSGRTSLWNGPACNKTLVLNAGGYYRMSGWVMYDGAEWTESQTFSMNMQMQQNGKEQYVEIGRVTAVKGEWAHIESNYTIPADASNFSVYFQTAWKNDASVTDQDLMNFYIDDVIAEPLPTPQAQQDIPSLKDVYKDYFILGGSCSKADLDVQAAKDIIVKHYDSITFGNNLKPDYTLDKTASQKMFAESGDDTNPQINIDMARKQLDFVSENNIKVRGHVLVWHSQTPDWFFKEGYADDGDWVTPEKMNKRLENYIKNLMSTLETEYPDVEFYAWDVVNEAFSEQGEMREAGSNNTKTGQSAWMSVYGDSSFINKAFEYARKYAPEGCKLFYNDYNEYAVAKRDAIIKKCAEIKAEGNIDGIGMQSHIGMSNPSIKLYEEAFRKYNELGLEIHVTELDVDQKSDKAEDLLALAKRYQDVFRLYKKLVADGVNITAVVTWGISDNTSWISGYPNLFDGGYQAKDAFYAVCDTEAEIQQINTASALEYDGTDEDYEKAFDLQSAKSVGGAADFKTIWNDNTATVRLNSDVDGTAEIIISDAYSAEDPTVVKKEIEVQKGEMYNIGINLSKYGIKKGSSLGLEIIITETGKAPVAWNTLDYTDKKAVVYGKLSFIEQPLSARAYNATVKIDGEIDSAWNAIGGGVGETESVAVNKYTMGTDGATATAKALWDENNIYVLVEVKDNNLSKESANAYEQDTVEIFIDQNNGKTSYYEDDDIQLRVNFDNEVTVTDGRTADVYETAAKKTADGYIVEARIPCAVGKFETGQVIGYDVQINDDNGSGKRTGIANWSDLSGQGYMNTSGFGTLKLEGSEDEFDLGDIDLDGDIDVVDVKLLQNYLIHKIRVIDGDPDINGDGKVNVFDLITLKKLVVK